eukprot:5745658-Amphidinium_carterae.1
MERRPSARLQPPGLQVQTRGPGFLASPILSTGNQQGRTSQATRLKSGKKGALLMPIALKLRRDTPNLSRSSQALV